jgi:hypothetical protein
MITCTDKNKISEAQTNMVVAHEALLKAKHAYNVAGGDYDIAKAAHYDAVHGNTDMSIEPVYGAMYCVLHNDFALEGSSDGECDSFADMSDCDLRDLFIESEVDDYQPLPTSTQSNNHRNE